MFFCLFYLLRSLICFLQKGMGMEELNFLSCHLPFYGSCSAFCFFMDRKRQYPTCYLFSAAKFLLDGKQSLSAGPLFAWPFAKRRECAKKKRRRKQKKKSCPRSSYLSGSRKGFVQLFRTPFGWDFAGGRSRLLFLLFCVARDE